MDVNAALMRQGVAAHQQGRFSEAKAFYKQILNADPDNFEALHLSGVAAAQDQDYKEAVDFLSHAVAVDDTDYTTHNNLGNVLRSLNRFSEALDSYDRSISINPTNARLFIHRALALRDLSRINEALESYDQAIALKPDYVEAFDDRGVVLKELMRLDEALASHDRALSLDPTYEPAYWNKALTLLTQGNFTAGWDLYEWRWRLTKFASARRNFAAPQWRGVEDLRNKTILLHAEQGFGDTIQFCRYAKLVKQRGARVVLEVPKCLARLLESLAGVDKIVERGNPLPHFDYHCPLLSLPFAFGTTLKTIPCGNEAYLQAKPENAEHWRVRLGERARPRIGVVWSGGSRPHQPQHWSIDSRRNIPLEILTRYIDVEGIDFYSLQKGAPAEAEILGREAQYWKVGTLHNYAADLHDFADTAALIENLDLVISVDTATAHLAAALGKPTWILNRFDTCWRWLVDRNDSPWYPTVRLFRQRNLGDWHQPLAEIRAQISK